MRPVHTLRSLFGRSLALKLVLAVLSVHVALIALTTWQMIEREGQVLGEQRLARTEGIASLLATSGAPWMLSEDVAGLGELIGSASSIRAVRYAMFVNASGRVLAHTEEARVGTFVDDPALRSAGPGLRLISTTDHSIDVAAPIRVNGEAAGWAWVSVSLADLRAREKELALSALGFGIAAILIGLAIALLTARGVTRRLADLAYATDRFRLGERTVRVAERGFDEVAAAARGVNAMFEAVAEGEQSLKVAQRIAQLGTWRYDPETRSLQWSDVVSRFFGHDPRAGPPTLAQFLDAVPEDQRSRVRSLLEEGDARGVSSIHLDLVRPDGQHRTCWIEARSERDRKTGKQILVGVCQDVTEREAAAAQLRQAQKMEAVGQLTGGLAHDFNNLLAIVIGNLDLLDEASADPEVRELAAEALAAALRGSELTKQLLAFSRRQPLAPQTVDLNALVAGVATLCRRTVGEAIHVGIDLAADLRLTRADPSQVESAILNLVINARDAMPEGGELTIETRNQRFDALDVRDGGEHEEIAPGDYSVITVSDTGHGMPPEIAAHAFEPFFTTKPVGQGSGLGLSMIYGFARQSGGHVRIESEAGRGTSVSIYLPSTAEDGRAAPEGAAGPSAGEAAGETILLVEDDEGVRRSTARQLEELGYRVVAAASGGEALKLLAADPQVELLFTDIVMPGGMNGLELSGIVRAKHPSVKILQTSGFTDSAVDGAADGAAAAPRLTKPYRKAELAAKLRQVLDAPVPATQEAS